MSIIKQVGQVPLEDGESDYVLSSKPIFLGTTVCPLLSSLMRMEQKKGLFYLCMQVIPSSHRQSVKVSSTQGSYSMWYSPHPRSPHHNFLLIMLCCIHPPI